MPDIYLDASPKLPMEMAEFAQLLSNFNVSVAADMQHMRQAAALIQQLSNLLSQNGIIQVEVSNQTLDVPTVNYMLGIQTNVAQQLNTLANQLTTTAQQREGELTDLANSLLSAIQQAQTDFAQNSAQLVVDAVQSELEMRISSALNPIQSQINATLTQMTTIFAQINEGQVLGRVDGELVGIDQSAIANVPFTQFLGS